LAREHAAPRQPRRWKRPPRIIEHVEAAEDVAARHPHEPRLDAPHFRRRDVREHDLAAAILDDNAVLDALEHDLEPLTQRAVALLTLAQPALAALGDLARGLLAQQPARGLLRLAAHSEVSGDL